MPQKIKSKKSYGHHHVDFHPVFFSTSTKNMRHLLIWQKVMKFSDLFRRGGANRYYGTKRSVVISSFGHCNDWPSFNHFRSLKSSIEIAQHDPPWAGIILKCHFQKLSRRRENIASGLLRMLYRNSNSPRYLVRCFLETWTCVPRMLRFNIDQNPSMELVW